MSAPVHTNLVNQVIRHPRTIFRAVVVNVNKRSVSTEACAFIPNYRTNFIGGFFFYLPLQDQSISALFVDTLKNHCLKLFILTIFTVLH